MGFLDRMVADMVTKSTGFNAKGLVRRVGGKRMMVLGGAALAGALLQDQMQGSSILSGGSSSAGATGSSGTRKVARSSQEMQARSKAAPAAPNPSLPPLPVAASGSPDAAGEAPPSAPPPPLPSAAVADPRAASPAVVPPPPPGASPPAPPAPSATESASGEPDDGEAGELPSDLVFAILRTMVAASLADGALGEAERQVITSRLEESNLSSEQMARVQQDLLSPASPHELAGMVTGDDRELLFRFATLIALSDDEVTERERTWLAQFGRTLELSAAQIEEIETDIYG